MSPNSLIPGTGPVMRCLLDLDGVLANFVKGACDLHQADPAKMAPGQWWFNESLGIKPEDFFKGMGREFWAGLEWLADGRRIVKLVEDLFGPANVKLVTSPVQTEGCCEGKLDWIKTHLPAYWPSKYAIDAAKHFSPSPYAILVDDSPENVRRFRAGGGAAVLVPRFWNDRHAEALAGRSFAALEQELHELLRTQRVLPR